MMGPGIRDYPFPPHRGSSPEEALANEVHEGQGMVISSGGKSHSSTKELKKPPPHMRPSPSRLNKHVSTVTEKASGHATSSSQGTVRHKECIQLWEGHQQNRATNVCTSSPKASQSLKEPAVKKHYEAGYRKIPSDFKDAAWGDSNRAEGLFQSFYCKKHAKSERNSGRHLDEAGPCTSAYQGPSADAMFLDFASVQIMKEDSDEDSGSDLSDLERIPIPPSPCTPPELNLRAEEIDPLCFAHLSDAKCKQSDYYYPDFLPPPFNTWDLKGLAAFVNTECKSQVRPQPRGSVEKYVDRLLELEWLQMQTIQAEKGKAAKARPQTPSSTLRTLKSPGKSKLLHTVLPNKNLTAPESFSRLPSYQLSHRRDLHSERAGQMFSRQGHSKATCCASAHQRQPSEAKSAEAKKQPSAKVQLFSTPPPESSSMIQGAGNIRPPKQSSLHGSAVPLKGLPAYTCPNPKKNGSTNSFVPSKKVQVDKKLKANGVKPIPCKFK